MAQQNINFGRFPTDPSADSLRIAFQKAQSNFTELYTNQSAQVTKVYADRGLTQNRTSGDVTLYANISSVTVQTSTNLKVGVTTASGRSATITTYETPLVFDIDPNIEVNSVRSNLLIGTIAASSNSQPNITSVGTLTSLNVSGNIDASWINASVNGPVVSPGSNNYVIINQSGLLGASSGLTYNGTALGVTGNATITGNIIAGNIAVGNVLTASNFSGPGGSTMQVIGNLNVGGNLSAGNISSGIINGSFNGSIGAITPDAGVFTGITVNDNLSADGDITSVAGVFYGNGSGLTNVNASNISGSVSTANSVNHSLTPGAYLTGSAFNGSADITFAIDGTSTATANKVAIRDGSGGLEATTFVGNLQYSISNGSYLNGGSFNNSGLVTLAVDATTTATASTVVARDSGGNVTANYFIGNGSGLTGVAASTLDNALSNGLYITGGSFNGSSNVTLAVDATTTATASKVVARDSSGNVYASRFVGDLDKAVIPGSYLTGGTFNNSANITLAVDATTAATASKVVARDSSGDVYANKFYGDFYGDGTGLTNVAASTLSVPVDELAFWNPNGEAGGTTWVVDTSGVDNSTDGVIAYGAGTYVIGFYGVVQAFPSSGTDPSNQMWRSTDGENWIGTTINGSTGVRVNGIAYGNDMFMVTCNDVTDGVYIATGKATSWGKIFWGGSTGTYSKLCFAYDKFFMYDGSNVKIYDTLTDQWSEENQTGTVQGVVKFGGGIMLSVDVYSGAEVTYSYDGINWNSYGSVLPAGVEWSDIVYGRGIWVAAGDSSGTPNLAYSLDNGLTWTAISGGSLASSTTGYLLAYGGGRFVCMSKSNATTNKFYTCDGEITTWATTNFASSAYYVGLAAGFDGFVAVPQQKANTFNTIYPAYTTDGSGVSSLYEYNTFGTIDGYSIGTTKPGDGTFLSVGTKSFAIPDISGFHIGGGASGKYIATDGTGNLYWGSGGVLGSNTEIQFNDAGSPNGSPGLTFNKYTNTATVTNLTVLSSSNLGNVGNVTITGGSANQYLRTNGSGSLVWANAGAKGSTTQVQYNDAGEFNGSSTFTFDNTTNTVTLTNLTGSGVVNFINTSNVSLGSNANVHITGGSSGQYLQTDGSGSLTWATVSTSAGGSNTNIQYNDGGTFNGISGFTYDKGTTVLSITSNISSNSTTTGSLVVTGGVGISGNLNATTKSFHIDHPTKPNMTLRYGSLEGPEFGVYVRGKLSGSTIITLPDYWEALVDVDTTTVTLTAIGSYQELYVKSVSGTTIEIDSTSETPINCYYTVYAERKDIPKIVVEEEKR